MKFTKKKTSIIAFMLLLTVVITGISACSNDNSKAGKEVKNAGDLSGAKIGVQLGTTGDIYVSDYEKDGSGTKVERYNKGADAIQALKLGKIDCVVIDEQPALEFVKQNTGLKILDDEFTKEDYALCIGKDNPELLENVNTALEKLQSDGTIDSIINNYIGSDSR